MLFLRLLVGQEENSYECRCHLKDCGVRTLISLQISKSFYKGMNSHQRGNWRI
jgi:hypothetical protein